MTKALPRPLPRTIYNTLPKNGSDPCYGETAEQGRGVWPLLTNKLQGNSLAQQGSTHYV